MYQKIPADARALFNKVPEITIFFWIIKVLCTTVGETFADFLNVNLNIGLTGTSIVMGVLLVIALFFQFRAKKYIPSIYWVTVALISVFGTLVTDNLTDRIGVPLEISTIVFSIFLAITFVIWYSSEKTLSIHSIFTKKREAFYWLTILFTFALGTAAGDLMAESLGLGYLLTGLIVAGVIIAAVIARKRGLNSVLSFWIIYIMTRPLGASIGDYLSQPHTYGGLGLGATGTSIIFIAGIIILVIYLSLTKADMLTNSVAKEEAKLDEKGGIWQTVITVIVLITIAVPAYFWRHAVLQKQSALDINSSADSTITQTLPLGDLSDFKKITEDTKIFILKNDFSGAKTRVTDLEVAWDNAQSRLKPMNKTKWTEVDTAIDQVLRQVRAVHPDQQKCIIALDTLLSVLN